MTDKNREGPQEIPVKGYTWTDPGVPHEPPHEVCALINDITSFRRVQNAIDTGTGDSLRYERTTSQDRDGTRVSLVVDVSVRLTVKPVEPSKP